MNCQQVNRYLPDYVDNVGMQDLREKIAEHIQECSHCRTNYYLTKVENEVLRQPLVVPEVPADFSAKVMQGIRAKQAHKLSPAPTTANSPKRSTLKLALMTAAVVFLVFVGYKGDFWDRIISEPKPLETAQRGVEHGQDTAGLRLPAPAPDELKAAKPAGEDIKLTMVEPPSAVGDQSLPIAKDKPFLPAPATPVVSTFNVKPVAEPAGQPPKDNTALNANGELALMMAATEAGLENNKLTETATITPSEPITGRNITEVKSEAAAVADKAEEEMSTGAEPRYMMAAPAMALKTDESLKTAAAPDQEAVAEPPRYFPDGLPQQYSWQKQEDLATGSIYHYKNEQTGKQLVIEVRAESDAAVTGQPKPSAQEASFILVTKTLSEQKVHIFIMGEIEDQEKQAIAKNIGLQSR